jgi:NAD(P)H-dependent flavin oxidoreductase YrpB (nitropropane dioxygenase family)
MSKIFDSTYPILCAPMNKVSDLTLAIASYDSGIFPSISIFNYFDPKEKRINYIELEKDLEIFRIKTGSSKILLSTSDNFLSDKEFNEIYDRRNFTHLEIIIDSYSCYYNDKKKIKIIENLKNRNIFLILKIWDYKTVLSKIGNLMDGFVLKGPNGAGTIPVDCITLEQRLLEILNRKPDAKIIASGGIYNGDQVKKLFSIGADSVAIGTLFALTQESCISLESKLKILESNSEMLTSVSDLKQNALIFSKIHSEYPEDYNNTFSLRHGIKSIDKGHVFVGKAIDKVKTILPLKAVVENLITELHS